MEFSAVYNGQETEICASNLYESRKVDISKGPLLSRGLDLLNQLVNYSFNTFPEILYVRLNLEVPEIERFQGPQYVNRWWSRMQRVIATKFDGMKGRQKRVLNMFWARNIEAEHEGHFEVALLLNALAYRDCQTVDDIAQLLMHECQQHWEHVFDFLATEGTVSDIQLVRLETTPERRKANVDKVFFELSSMTRTGMNRIDKHETLFVSKKGVVPFDIRRKKRSRNMRG